MQRVVKMESGSTYQSDSHTELQEQSPYISTETINNGKTEGAKIFFVELCERLGFFGLNAVLSPYVRDKLNWGQHQAAGITNFFNFTAYFACVFGGWVADNRIGRKKAITRGCVIYVIGLLCITLNTWVDFIGDSAVIFSVGLALVGLGTGGIKPSIAPIYADQQIFKTEEARSSSFRWFYWGINIGAFAGTFITPLLHDDKRYWSSFLMPTIAVCIALITFQYFKRGFRDNVPSSLQSNEIKSILSLRFRKRIPLSQIPQSHPELTSTLADFRQALIASKVFLFFPIYWLAYNQGLTNFVWQAYQLERPEWMPGEFLLVVNSLTIITLIPVMDFVGFPMLEKCGKLPTNSQRIVIGFVMQGVSMLMASVLQFFIQSALSESSISHSSSLEGSSGISFWWQIPQLALGAASEIFTSIGGLEFAYSGSPKSMRSLVMSLYLVSNAVASLVGIVFSPLMKPHNMTTIYFVLFVISVVAAVMFVWCFRSTNLDAGVEQSHQQQSINSTPGIELQSPEQESDALVDQLSEDDNTSAI